MDTVAPNPQLVFVTSAADCLALVEEIQQAALEDLSVPVRILILEDGVPEQTLDALVAASGGDVVAETISYRAVRRIARLVRTPFAVAFGDGAEIIMVESVGGTDQNDLMAVNLFRASEAP